MFLLNNYTTTSQGVQQDFGLQVDDFMVDFTSNELAEKPTYIIKVVKTY